MAGNIQQYAPSLMEVFGFERTFDNNDTLMHSTNPFKVSTPASLSQTGLRGEMALAAVVGIASHLGFFIHGEHHMESPALFWLHVVGFSLLTYATSMGRSLNEGATEATCIFASYLFALFSSIAIYRRYFHRLRHFPGPGMMGVTKLVHTAQCMGSQNHILLDKLHKQHGDFVRTGPTELTVFKPEVKWAVDGPLNKCTKAVWYDILLPLVALNTNRSKKEHDQRRRAWDQAITVKTLSGYEARIQEHARLLEKHIASTSGQAVNVTELFYFLAFDVMGDFAFSKSFDMLESQEWHYAVKLLRRALGLLGPFSSVPWLAQLAFSFPMIPVIRDWNYMLGWCGDRMAEQIPKALTEENPKKDNISSWLIHNSIRKSSLAKDKTLLKGDSVALIVAGSDTVASTMINLFYRLALHPDHAEKVREEVNSLASIYDSNGLKSLKHLNGVINEILRLHPSVPTGGYRESPKEGVEIAGTWIPGNITIVAPRYTIGRLESLYEQPDDFVPERWYSRPEMVKDKNAFNPFSIGRYSCVGKNLALAEIRFVTAMLVSKYDVSFAPGTDGSTVWKEMKDQFTAVPGKLDLVFTPLE